ncbi:DUF4936 family protein [Pseudoduganella lutea]|uniref:DUF4936 family protein n=1 Tax=Pseudoduganella lutea TaxID=321985 RepID=A0A4P6L4Q1_9BURK|nr:DUF4936 family protein [Pseudoduganella lutea]QBE66467.1 DUF4936 family protein [Pseudoduganella lutea]
MDLYVYYRVRDEDAGQLLPRVRVMQAQLAAAHGVAPQLKRRPESTGGMQTWMEVYPATLPDFTDALAHAADASNLGPLVAGPRHTEVFMDISSCA